MKHAVVIDCLRTPIGRAHKQKGNFRNVRSDDLAVAVVEAAREADWHRSRRKSKTSCSAIPSNKPSKVWNVARTVALMAGFADGDRRDHGQSPVRFQSGGRRLIRAAHAAVAGGEDVQIVGGLEHMQHLPMALDVDLNPKLFRRTSKGALMMGATAEFLAQRRKAFRAKSKTPSHCAAISGLRPLMPRVNLPRSLCRCGDTTRPAIGSSSIVINASGPIVRPKVWRHSSPHFCRSWGP